MNMKALNSAVSFQLYKLNIHNVVAEFVPLIMNTIAIQVSTQAR
jgi:transformation/transcription domain-associated protein